MASGRRGQGPTPESDPRDFEDVLRRYPYRYEQRGYWYRMEHETEDRARILDDDVNPGVRRSTPFGATGRGS